MTRAAATKVAEFVGEFRPPEIAQGVLGEEVLLGPSQVARTE